MDEEPLVHPVTAVVAAGLVAEIVAAWFAQDLAAQAGHIEGRWPGLGMVAILGAVAIVTAGAWFVPVRVPGLVRRVGQLAAMAGAVWATGTLLRALYALTH